MHDEYCRQGTKLKILFMHSSQRKLRKMILGTFEFDHYILNNFFSTPTLPHSEFMSLCDDASVIYILI